MVLSTIAGSAGSLPAAPAGLTALAAGIDGRQACFLAFVSSGATTGSVLLVDAAGVGIPSNGTASNSRCTINAPAVP